MTTPVLEGRGIGKVFGAGDLAVRALRPTDIAVRRGEIMVVMGPSGSGKTTLLSILGLVLEPSEGEVLLDGRRVTGSNADVLAQLRRDKVGFIFQQFNLLAGLTALDNVTIPLLLRGTSAKERGARARQVLDIVGLQSKAKRKARQLSVGQQQRVAIARALVADAGVLLCDEPTASLDGQTGRGVLETLQRLAHAQDRAVVIVTHDERVLRFADRLVHVEDGQSREEDLHRDSVKGETHEPSS
jgi:putative ABC transport system ATP-binding protein